jgi:predicted metalloendopeptidase
VAGVYSRHQLIDRRRVSAEAVIAAISRTFAERLSQVGWMDEQTRAAGGEKIRTLEIALWPGDVRHPLPELVEHWHLANVLAARRVLFASMIHDLGAGAARPRLGPPTWIGNAFYLPERHAVVFPGALLQAPFLDPAFPPAMNFGAFGMVAGHEITHALTGEGRHFDAAGRRRDWWTETTAAAFAKQAECVVDHYARFSLPGRGDRWQRAHDPSLRVDGRRSLDENVADLAGVRVAYRAYREGRNAGDEPPNRIADLSGDQLFFVAYAQIWCSVMSSERERISGTAMPHAPARVRVNAILSSLPEFAEAFACPVGAPMRPDQVCDLW